MDLRVYPSPLTDHLYVRSDELQGSSVDVKLISVSGQTWYHANAEIINNEIRLSGLDHLPKGSYLCYIGNSESKLVVKVMK